LTKLGLIIPSSNTTLEPEFYRMLPKTFSVHITRLALKEVSVEALAKMEEKIEDEALKLADAEVDVIGYGCTSGSLFKGLGHDKQIEMKIERTVGIPAVATSSAVVAALKHMKVTRVAVATPYILEINRLVKKFLLSNMFQVVDLKSFGIKDNLKIGKLPSEETYRLVTRLNYAKADAIFISCTNLATVNIIQRLEKTTGKIVVSSNTATLWAMLKKCGARISIKDFGRLLETL
jgi:maleate isomerase